MALITIIHDVDVDRRGDGSAPADMDGDYIDTWLDENDPTREHGEAGAHKVGGQSTSKGVPAQRANGLYMYDLNYYLPADAVIVSGDWHFYVYQLDLDAEGIEFIVARCTRPDWVENEATWNDYKSGSAWTAPGGDSGAPSLAFTNPVLGWMSRTVTSIVADAWANRNGICTFLIGRLDGGWNLGPGYFYHYTKNYYPTDPTIA